MTKWLLVLALFLGAVIAVTPGAAVADSPRPDIFPIDPRYVPRDVDGDGDRDMQDLNPTNIKAKANHEVSYRVVTLAGCNTGVVPDDLQNLVEPEFDEVNFTLTRNDRVYDFTIYVSCGLTQVAKCGSVSVFCLPDGFPYNTDIYISDVISGYTLASRLSIPLHELMHAIGTWNEQYAECGASCGFAPSPNWIDFMNTGVQSRVGFTENTLDRWDATMYPVIDGCDLGKPNVHGHRYDNCYGIWRADDGNFFYFNDLAGVWMWNWSGCNADGLRWNTFYTKWETVGSAAYDPDRAGGFWTPVPEC